MKPPEAPEKILKKCAGYHKDHELELSDDITIGEALAAMHEYASKFPTLPSDEEIEKMASEIYKVRNNEDFKEVEDVAIFRKIFIVCAGLFRDRVTSQFTAPEKGVKS